MAKNMIALDEVQSVYEALYEDQLEAAYDDYLEEFEPNYDPSGRDFSTEESAASALRSLIGELEEDRTDLLDMFDQFGVTPDILKWLGREDLVRSEKEA